MVWRGVVAGVLALLVVACCGLYATFRSLKQKYHRARARRRQAQADQLVVGFFHPYCNAGGGGERVLWCAVRAIQRQYPNCRCVVYTGDRGCTGEEILRKAKKSFNVQPLRPVEFVFLRRRQLVEASCYPVLTLLGQSLGSILLGFEAINILVPDIYLDTMGYAFTYPLFKILAGCQVGAYVHYPTISTDMLEKVKTREESYNNRGAISRSPILSSLKLIYYRWFAWLYGLVGRQADVVMTNSSWTLGNIRAIWRIPERTGVVYPPCDTEGFMTLPLAGEREPGKVVSVAQFRPEKDHSLQLKVLQQFFETCPEQRSTVKLYMVGGCRNEGDEERVRRLKRESQELGIAASVVFKTNVTYAELKSHYATAVVGLHTMWNEHFGIGVVEYMASGCIPLAHDTAGPKMDIVLDDYHGQRTGFRATTAEEYSEKLKTILVDMTDEERLRMQTAARESVATRFSEAAFDQGFLKWVGVIMPQPRRQ